MNISIRTLTKDNFKNSNKNQLKDTEIDLKDYNLLDNEDSCYYYKKK